MLASATVDAVRTVLIGTSVNPDTFFQKLAEFFGYKDTSRLCDEDVMHCRFEDLEECGLPRGKARQVAAIFRGQETMPAKVVLDLSNDPEKLATTLPPVDCVAHYRPDDPTSPFGRRLAEATKGRKCLAFDGDGRFDAEMSKLLVQEILDGYPQRDSVTIDGVPGLPTYAIGERPDRYVAENPARPGTPLSPMHDIAWETIALDIRQLVYLAVKETKEAVDNTGKVSVEFDLFEKVTGRAFAEVAKRFPLAAKLFQQRKAANTLPQLRIRIGNGDSAKSNDPFHVRS